jgi:hypothetical protein
MPAFDHVMPNSPADYEKHGSLLRGDMGAALLAMRVAPTSSLADWYIGAPKRIMNCQFENLCGACPGRWSPRSICQR